MGTAALSDAKSMMSIAIAHNMDNVEGIKQTDLKDYFGLDDQGYDASKSKFMVITTNGKAGHYDYKRGGITLHAELDYETQKIKWNTDCTNDTRVKALADGLKISAPASISGATATDSCIGGTCGFGDATAAAS